MLGNWSEDCRRIRRGPLVEYRSEYWLVVVMSGLSEYWLVVMSETLVSLVGDLVGGGPADWSETGPETTGDWRGLVGGLVGSTVGAGVALAEWSAAMLGNWSEDCRRIRRGLLVEYWSEYWSE
jgi:hypothetical protein